MSDSHELFESVEEFRAQFFSGVEIVTCLQCGRKIEVSRIEEGNITVFIPPLDVMFGGKFVDWNKLTIGDMADICLSEVNDVEDEEDAEDEDAPPVVGVFFCGACAYDLKEQGANFYPLQATVEKVFLPVWERSAEKNREAATVARAQDKQAKRVLRMLAKGGGLTNGTKRQRQADRREQTRSARYAAA